MLLYITGGVVTAVGALSATMWLLRLIRQFGWPRRRAAAQGSPVISPRARRRALNRFWFAVALTVNGMILILSAHSDTAAWISIVTTSALLLWMLGEQLISRRQHRPAT